MDFNPKNPLSIPVNIEYKPEIERNPFSIWTSYASTADDPKFMKVEKQLFIEICKMLEIAWEDINRKSIREKTDVLAKFLHNKLSIQSFEFLKDDAILNKIVAKLGDVYKKNYSGKNSSTDPEIIQIKQILDSVIPAVEKCISDIETDAQKQIRHFRNELFLKFLSKSSIKKIVQANQDLISADVKADGYDEIVIQPENIDAISKNTIDNLEFSVSEDLEDANIFEEKIEEIQNILKSGQNDIQYRLKTLQLNKAQSNIRLLTVSRLKSYYHNLNVLSERTKKTWITRNFSKIGNFMVTIAGKNGFKLLTEKFKNPTVGDLLFKISSFNSKKEFRKATNQIPLLNAKAYKLVTVPFKAISAYVLTINIIAFKTLETTAKTIKKGLLVLGKLINKVGNSIYTFLSNPINAFTAAFIGSAFIQMFANLKSNALKKFLTAFGKSFWKLTKSFGKLVITYFAARFKKFWKKLEKDYPFLKVGKDFTLWLIEKIRNSRVFKIFNWAKNKVKNEVVGLIDVNKHEFKIRKYEFEKKNPGEKYSIWDYLTDPGGLLKTTFAELKNQWNSTVVGQLFNRIFKLSKFILKWAGKAFKHLIFPVVKFLTTHKETLNILTSLLRFFTTEAGLYMQIIGGAFGPWGLLLSLAGFVIGDLFYRAAEKRSESDISIKKRYKNLYGIDIDSTRTEVLNNYIDSGLEEYLKITYKSLTPTERNKKRIELTNNFGVFYSSILSEASTLDDAVDKLMEYKPLIESDTQGRAFSDIPSGIIQNIFHSDFLNSDFKSWSNHFNKSDSLAVFQGNRKNQLKWQYRYLMNFAMLRQGILDEAFLNPLIKTKFHWHEIEKMMDPDFLKNIGKTIDDIFVSKNVGENLFSFSKTKGDLISSANFLANVWNDVTSKFVDTGISESKFNLDANIRRMVGNSNGSIIGTSVGRIFGNNIGTTDNVKPLQSASEIKTKTIERIDQLLDTLINTPNLDFGRDYLPFDPSGRNVSVEDVSNYFSERKIQIIDRLQNSELLNPEWISANYSSWEEFLKKEVLSQLFTEEDYLKSELHTETGYSYDETIDNLYRDLTEYYKNNDTDEAIAKLMLTVSGFCELMKVDKKTFPIEKITEISEKYKGTKRIIREGLENSEIKEIHHSGSGSPRSRRMQREMGIRTSIQSNGRH